MGRIKIYEQRLINDDDLLIYPMYYGESLLRDVKRFIDTYKCTGNNWFNYFMDEGKELFKCHDV